MPITGKFAADFNAFYDACAKAETSLRLVKRGAQEVEQSVNQAADSGPLLFQSFGKAAADATPKVSGLHSSFQQFDSLLASVGIHIGPEIKAIGEIGAASGSSAAGLGGLTTAGLALGAGIAGWKIGRAVAEFFDLDNKIANATAKLLGFGDVAAATAGAKADALAIASARAGREITDMGDAVAINNAWLKDHQKAAQDAVQADERWAGAMVELNSVGRGWQGTLQTIDGTVVEAIKFYLDAGVSQDKLATAFQLTAAQIKSVTSAVAADEAALKELAKADEITSAAIKAHWSDVGTIIDRVLGKPQLKAANDWVDAIELLGGSVEQLSTNELADLNTAMLAAIDVMFRTGHLTDELANKYAALALASMPPAIKAVEDMTDSLYQDALAQDAARNAQAKQNEELAKVPALTAAAASGMAGYAAVTNGVARDLFGRPVAGSQSFPAGVPAARAVGGPVSAGQPYMVGERGPELFVPRGSGSILPNTGGGMNVSIVINGSVLGNKEQIASAISEALTQRLKATGLRFPMSA